MIETILANPILLALAALVGMAIVFGGLLGFAAVRFEVEGNALRSNQQYSPADTVWTVWLSRLRPYAEAIADGDSINKCPPGGEDTIQALANLLDVEPEPLDAEHGVEAEPTVAYIREDECIGCTKCIQACPVDAILGAAKQMHTVIIDECTGCDLCVEPCPVDCIDMIPRKGGIQHWYWPLPDDSSRDNLIATDRSSDETEPEQAAA